jgi:hypothetical protein
VVEDGKEELYEKESQTANTEGTMEEREKEEEEVKGSG